MADSRHDDMIIQMPRPPRFHQFHPIRLARDCHNLCIEM